MEKYRQIKEMECSSCDLRFYCRGCPAVSFGNYGTWEKRSSMLEVIYIYGVLIISAPLFNVKYDV